MSKRKYYSLLVREFGRWTIQFGDYDRAAVQQEREDEYSKSTETKIITTDSDQGSITAAVAKLNGDVR